MNVFPEFELIWNLSRLIDEKKRIENQNDSKGKGPDVSYALEY